MSPLGDHLTSLRYEISWEKIVGMLSEGPRLEEIRDAKVKAGLGEYPCTPLSVAKRRGCRLTRNIDCGEGADGGWGSGGSGVCKLPFKSFPSSSTFMATPLSLDPSPDDLRVGS